MMGRLAHQSLAALNMAASGRWPDSAVLAQWLYRFGSLPRGPAYDLDFGPEDDPMSVIDMTRGCSTRARLEDTFEASSQGGWYSFARRPVKAQMAPACKLYVSPVPHALTTAFPLIAKAFADLDVRSFKVGRGIEGLLRTDKIIAYFDHREHMEEVACALAGILRDCPAHGVPFSAELGGDGLLSWGVDPPAGDPPVSWRSWLTKQLASSLTSTCAHGTPHPARAACSELEALGVDTNTWAPRPDFLEAQSRS